MVLLKEWKKLFSFSNPAQDLKALAVRFDLRRSLYFLVGGNLFVSEGLSGGEGEMGQASITHLVVVSKVT